MRQEMCETDERSSMSVIKLSSLVHLFRLVGINVYTAVNFRRLAASNGFVSAYGGVHMIVIDRPYIYSD